MQLCMVFCRIPVVMLFTVSQSQRDRETLERHYTGGEGSQQTVYPIISDGGADLPYLTYSMIINLSTSVDACLSQAPWFPVVLRSSSSRFPTGGCQSGIDTWLIWSG